MTVLLNDAARTWNAHLGSAQQQMRDATEQLLQGFAQILDQLDAITAPATDGRQAGLSSANLDHRAQMLAECEA